MEKINKDLRFKDNPRVITEAQRKRLAEHLEELGDLSGVVYCRNNKAYAGGNQRSVYFDGCPVTITEVYEEPTKTGTIALGWIEKGGERYAYREVSWSEDQFRKACIVANNDGGDWDYTALAEWDKGDLADWGFEMSVFEEETKLAQEDGYEMPDEIETDIKPGNIFQIGDHRLMCGDSGKKEDVKKLMDGQLANMIFTDPPYEIDFDYTNAALFSQNAHVFVFNNDRAIIRQLSKSPFVFKKFFVFNHSGTAIPQEGGNEVFLDHILISHEINGTPKTRYNKGSGTRTVIKGEYRRSQNHKHEKPISLLEPILKGYSSDGDLALDFFAGGGSLFSACEQLSRRCYGMEISPQCCQIIINRMKRAFPEIEVKKIR